MKPKLTFIHALSPLHAGTGQGVDVIDLPIAREKATNIPYLPGSSVKGTLRDLFNDEKAVQTEIFGPEKIEGGSGKAGAIQFADQTLLFLPVRSLAGTFAYVTSPYVLKRFLRDVTNAEIVFPNLVAGNLANEGDSNPCLIATDSVLKLNNFVCLEDLDLTPENDRTVADGWANELKNKIFDESWQDEFAARLCIVSDNIFSFLLQTATQITARNVLNEDKSSENLWYEESLPTESILYGIVLSFPNPSTKLNDDEIFWHMSTKLDKTLQFGGNATIGRGLCNVKLFPKEASE
ncbi:MAG: type III-B CRISPR module RAMP protein Cmr4 [Pyrinomonadaceae bacterium]